jgi:ATP/maltotriose-dependent transcriptional regulator MalT
VVDALKPGFTRAFAHAGVAVATARAGTADAAEKIAGTIEDARARLDALIGIAEVLGAQGAQAEALAIGAAAAELARTLDNPVERAFSLIDLAQLAGRTGDAARAAALLKEATAIARGVDDPFGRTRSLSRIAVALATLGSD